MRYRCLIIDDEPLARRVLKTFLKQIPQWELAGEVNNALDAIEFMRNQPSVDLLLLDVNMPELSGINMMRSIPNPPKVIFITAYPEYAVDGFDLEAVDYLLKPVAPERFFKAMARAARALAETPSSLPLQQAKQALLVRADRKLHRLPWADIRYLEAYGDYVKIHLADQLITPKEKLSQLEQQLPQDVFQRIHRSYIIALAAVSYVEGNQVRLADRYLPISAQYKDILLDRLG